VYGPNALRAQRELTRLSTLARQFQSPLLLLLVFAAGASAISGEWIDAAIVVTIVVATVLIGYSREYSAQSAAAALRARLKARSVAVRDGKTIEIPSEEIVAGDIV
jgi:P-type Mg2+ transporter